MRHPLLDALEALNLPDGDWALFGSGPLLVRGWIDQVGDLDVIARGAAWESALQLGHLVHLDEHGVDVVQIGDDITVGDRWAIGEVDVDELIDTAEVIAGIPCVRLEHVIVYKQLFARDKDLRHLEVIATRSKPNTETSGPVDDRRLGALLGLAIGDALGAAVEFMRPGSFEPVTGYRAGGPHRLGAGEWTDDTSMALALADSIASVGWDLDDQARRYLSWYKTGEYSVNGRCFDIGNTTRRALERFSRDGDASIAGGTTRYSAGNGSIMRLAPVPIRFADLYPDRVPELIRLGWESSLPTHRVSQATSACAYMTLVLAALMHGEPRETVLDPGWDMLAVLETEIDVHPEIAQVMRGGFRRTPPQIKGSGYVVRSLEAGLWALNRFDSFEDAVLAAVNLGDDADTTGAVAGQFAGAHWGRDGIPPSLLDGLAKRTMVEAAGRRLLL